MIYRYSSRRENLDSSFLTNRLQGARLYDRIAGYFSSSILEVAGESIESMSGKGCVRVICNSQVQLEDMKTAQQAQNAIRREWCQSYPELLEAKERYKKLYSLLRSGKLQIRVLPDKRFGLIHGKAGVITLQDGTKTSFIGSTNESFTGWELNYEILWEDDSEEAINWVQDEFDALWNDPSGVPLPEFVVQDLYRISERKVLYSIEEWEETPDAAPVIIESPIYRKEYGLWEHQKYFIHLAYTTHMRYNNARYILADQVGLGKTIQLALAAQLIALHGDKPILIIPPKTLLWQWQDELSSMLDLPCAVWTGKSWVDENKVEHPVLGEEHIKKCPRRIGIISQGLIVARSAVVDHLLNLKYECVIVDEAHKARRKRLTPGKEHNRPEPNNLMEFLNKISTKTKSMFLATATPVQINPIEAWDLLNILSQGSQSVMGDTFSLWKREPGWALDLSMNKEQIDSFNLEAWEWLHNPFPPAEENEQTFGVLRRNLNIKENEAKLKPELINELSPPDRARCERIIEDGFFLKHNPFIRHIVRRTREYLENTINPETNEPYLKKVEVVLWGEKEEETIVLPPYLQQAYDHAEEYCSLLKKRVPEGGFIRTLLLKRVGSTIVAGKNTAEKMLYEWDRLREEEDEEEELSQKEIKSEIKNLTEEERSSLSSFIKCLEVSEEKDPKYHKVYHLLVQERWIDRGCIIFSQYYDSAYWVADSLSKDLPLDKIGIYAGGDGSGVLLDGVYKRKTKEEVKEMVRNRELRVLIGTEAASEGLNLQTLGSLINLDLPWNPTKLEQRKGRIQRIGQAYDKVWIYNMRYKDSVEDRVHELLSERLENIKDLFGQLPDILEDVWVDVALNEIEEAKTKIKELPDKHPFEMRYHQEIKEVDWETCSLVLDSTEKKKYFMDGWYCLRR